MRGRRRSGGIARRRGVSGRSYRRALHSMPDRTCIRFNAIIEIMPKEWFTVRPVVEADAVHQLTAMIPFWKEVQLAGAYVSMKRYQPPVVQFGTGGITGFAGKPSGSYATVDAAEVYWLPTPSMDKPEVHPRESAGAIQLGDSFVSKFIPSKVVKCEYYLNHEDKEDKSNLKHIYRTSNPPWMPIDGVAWRANDPPSDFQINSHRFGFVYSPRENSDSTPMQVEICAKLYYKFRFRKSQSVQVDTSNRVTAEAILAKRMAPGTRDPMKRLGPWRSLVALDDMMDIVNSARSPAAEGIE